MAQLLRRADTGPMPDTAPATPIDLSRLPAPEVVEQISFEAILAALIAAFQDFLPDFDALVESEPAMKLLQAFAYREMVLRQQFNDRARSVMLAYAGGGDLDQLAALVGVVRLTITPANPLTGAAAVMESDDALRQRVVLAPESYSGAGPELAYIFHALSAHPDVLDASATSPAPGEVVVTLLSRDHRHVPAPVLDIVEAAVNAREVRPLTDAVTVQRAEIVDYAIEAALHLLEGPDSSVVLAAAQANIDAYAAASRRLGRDVALSGIYAALHVEGVARVVLAAPLADIAISGVQAANCTGITITVAGSGD